jgi:transcription-repair coupling factor (superfamily II helicase)
LVEGVSNLNLMYKPLENLAAFGQIVNAVSAPGVCAVSGVDDCQRLHLAAALQQKTGRPILFVTSSGTGAQRAAEDFNHLLGGGAAALSAREVSFLRAAASSRDLTISRLEALGMAATGHLRALAVPVDALLDRLMPRARFLRDVLIVREGQQLDPGEMMARLIEAGYERVDVTEARGQCALRGGILDVYPVGQPNALRLEFFDDEVDSLRDFDVMTQRSIARRTEAAIYPASEVLLTPEEAQAAALRLEAALSTARGGGAAPVDRQREIEKEFGLMPFEQFFEMTGEGDEDALPSMFAIPAKPAPARRESPPPRTALARNFTHRLDALHSGHATEAMQSILHLIYAEPATLIDYFDEPIIVMDQPERLRERCDNRALEFQEQFKTALSRDEAMPAQAGLLFAYDEILPRLDGCAVITLNPFARTIPDFKPSRLVKIDGLGARAYQGNMRELKQDVDTWKAEGWRVALLAGGVARGQRLNRALFENDCPVPFVENPPEALEAGQPVILPFALSRGFVYSEIKFAVVAEGDIFGVSKQRGHRKAGSSDKMSAFTDLQVGDFVVHENHGIGRYMGTVRLASEGTLRDFLHIQYMGSDKLYVPTDQMDRIQKYIGQEGATPRLNRLSGGEWQRQKAKVRSSIHEIAGELVKLYAARTAATGFAFSPDTPWQRQFEDSFEYEETPDQVQAIEDIKRDMERPQIMDRLLCGDVGYGKTEVALRAIFKCVMDGKQAALLAPTTILVQQHYATMTNRFHGFPVRIATLSRFSTAAEQKKTLAQLAAGELDVVIGTHRLLGKDVAFKNIGLLVVDEEQRFGVKHKETIKQMKRNIDVLTLSATPIPRTLHMSMVGIRDMSLLQTPPDERYPVQTYVVEYTDGLVRDAILREISRGGQVYVLYNRVKTIEAMYARLKKLVPEARIAVGHGQMREHALEDVMLDFYEGKHDVLLCTTIIEAGLDVPRANTLIVCDADRFGLSQLYQLRGRVGRSNKLAYAFLTVSPNKILTENADKRLSSIREFTEFGSGFRVAMRDLEIRGTGNLLGSEQSGHMASVGYDLYVKMIEEAMRDLRGDVRLGDIQTKMELKIDAYLPSEYVRNDMTRVEIYKRIAQITTRAAREDVIEELIDRFGDPARPVMNLIEIAHMKNLCQRLGIDLVSAKAGALILRFSQAAQVDVVKLVAALRPFEKTLRLQAGRESAIVYQDGKKPLEDQLSGAVLMLEEIADQVAQQGAQADEGAGGDTGG